MKFKDVPLGKFFSMVIDDSQATCQRLSKYRVLVQKESGGLSFDIRISPELNDADVLLIEPHPTISAVKPQTPFHISIVDVQMLGKRLQVERVRDTSTYHVSVDAEIKHLDCSAEDVMRALGHYINSLSYTLTGES